MARPPSPTITEAEREILEVLWDQGEATVREVADVLSRRRSVAYTTVLTMLNVLARKTLVTHRPEGRAFIYRAAITRDQACTQALDHLLQQFFKGSPSILAQHLVNVHDIDRAALTALHDKVDAAKVKAKGKKR